PRPDRTSGARHVVGPSMPMHGVHEYRQGGPGNGDRTTRSLTESGVNMLDLGRTFLQSVERSPGALAVADGDRVCSYAQWHDDIAALAAGLKGMGLRQGDRVLVVLQN